MTKLLTQKTLSVVVLLMAITMVFGMPTASAYQNNTSHQNSTSILTEQQEKEFDAKLDVLYVEYDTLIEKLDSEKLSDTEVVDAEKRLDELDSQMDKLIKEYGMDEEYYDDSYENSHHDEEYYDDRYYEEEYYDDRYYENRYPNPDNSEKLQIENQQLKDQITKLEASTQSLKDTIVKLEKRIDDLNMILKEQLKVLMDAFNNFRK